MKRVGTALVAATIAALFFLEGQSSQEPLNVQALSQPGVAPLAASQMAATSPSSEQASVQTTPKRVREPIRNHLASHILGLTVENRDGQKLGKVKDLLVDLRSGAIPYVVLSSGGFLGVGSRFKIVPGSALSTATVIKGTAVLGISKVRWVNAPGFKRSELAGLGQPDRRRQIYQFYGEALDRPGSPTDLRLASDILGRGALGRRQENLGSVLDLLVDLAGQRPSFAILSADHPLKGQASFAVAVRSLRLSAQGVVMLDVEPAQFERAGRFDEVAWEAARTNSAPQIYRLQGTDLDGRSREPPGSAHVSQNKDVPRR